MPLAVQSSGRLVPHRPDPDHPQTIFVSSGADPTLDNLLMALGHRLLSVPAGAAGAVAVALAASSDAIRLVDEVKPRIIVEGNELDLSSDRARLVDDGRDWLAEIAVLALEFHNSPIIRSTARTRQALFEDFRRMRIVSARQIEVEIDGRTGPLPDMLDGILPVPHRERPTVVVQSADDGLDWPKLARLSRGIALALGRGWLLNDFRVAFLAIASDQPKIAGQLTRPDDEAIASAFGQPVARVREIQRSLRADSRRIMDWLVPIAAVQLGVDAANALIDRETLLVEDDEIAVAIVAAGGTPAAARALIAACREAESLDELRRTLGIPLAAFNAACAALGPRFAPLRFDVALRRSFQDRVDELRPSIARRIRDAYAAASLTDIRLDLYREALSLSWVTFEETWPDTHDELDDATIDARIGALAAAVLPAPTTIVEASVDEIRQENRTTLTVELEAIRRLGAAWSAKVSGRSVPNSWSAKPETFVRDAIATGVLDFHMIKPASLSKALAHAGMWPAGMPTSTRLDDLGLLAADLDVQRREEESRRQDDERRSRSITLGSHKIEGGASGSLQAVVDALQAGLASKAFQSRSGPAVLSPFPEGDERPPRRRTRGESNREPTFLTDQQRDLIGFAGEYAAYVHLKRTVRNFADEHWVSSLGRRYLGLMLVQDGGFDFRVPRWRGGLHYEVKSHTGDPGHIDLERSQVEAAVQFANEKDGIWRILYVANVLDPDLIAVHELPNPFSEGNMRLFRPSNRQGVRLLIDRQCDP